MTELFSFNAAQQWATDMMGGFGIWGYLLLALLVALEGPMATLAGAAAVSMGAMHLPGVFGAAVIGNLCADSLWYGVGRLGKTRWLLHFGNRFGVSPEKMDKMQERLHTHASQWIFVAKLTAGLMIPTLVVAGLLKIPCRRWFPAVFAGEMIWSTILILLGYFATGYLIQIAKGFEMFAVGSALLVVAGMIFWLRPRMLARMRPVEDRNEAKPIE